MNQTYFKSSLEKLRLKVKANSFELIIVCSIAIIFLISLIATNSVRSYTSDDTTDQTIIQDWQNGEPRSAIVGQDTYVLKAPFFIVQNLLEPNNSRVKLFIQALVFNIVLFIGVISFVHYCLDRIRFKSRTNILLAYLPLGWLLGLRILPLLPNYQVSRITAIISPDVRNAEVGIAFLLLTLFLKYLNGREVNSNLRKAWLVIILVFSGLFLYDDPYFLYMLVVPCLVLLGIFWTTRKVSTARSVVIIFYAIGAVIVSFAFSHFVKSLGLTVLNNVPHQFIDLSQIGSNLVSTWGAELKQFSANISGQVINEHLLPELLNASFMIASLLALIYSLTKLNLKEPAKLVLLIITSVNLLTFSLTTVNVEYADRYIFIALFTQVMTLSLSLLLIKQDRVRRVIIAFLCLGILVNVASNLHVIYDQTKPSAIKPNAINYQIINTVNKYHLTKGYASYWDGNINTYLSNLKIHFLPVVCSNQKLYKFDWVVNTPDFRIPASKSFYLYSSDNSSWTSINNCTPQSLQTLFGVSPSKSIRISNQYTLYIYNQDIGTKIL